MIAATQQRQHYLMQGLILVHANSDITERIYTHKTHLQLVQAIDKILV